MKHSRRKHSRRTRPREYFDGTTPLKAIPEAPGFYVTEQGALVVDLNELLISKGYEPNDETRRAILESIEFTEPIIADILERFDLRALFYDYDGPTIH